MLILPALAEGPVRNGELLRRIEGISQKVLTQTLRQPERHGLVIRVDYQEKLLVLSIHSVRWPSLWSLPW